MAASRQTVTQILSVLAEYVPDPGDRCRLAETLQERVGGNQSVRATLEALARQAKDDVVHQARLAPVAPAGPAT